MPPEKLGERWAVWARTISAARDSAEMNPIQNQLSMNRTASKSKSLSVTPRPDSLYNSKRTGTGKPVQRRIGPPM